MTKIIKRFAHDSSGGTGIEYALLAGVLAIAVLAAVELLSEEAVTSFENTANAFKGVSP
jgi:pilus assembly protein Flp/PilA